jgi:shikimate dehydrogenase
MRKFGLIGFPLSHSFSKKYFTDIFLQEGIDALYENYPLTDVGQVKALFDDPLMEGINVTIPYKEAIIPYLDDVSEAVKQIGACNCIRIKGGIRTGFNTDVIGFERSFEKKLKPHHQKALVLGTGGAAKAVLYVLKQRSIEALQVSRTPSDTSITYGDLTAEMMNEYALVINTTPVGMYPDTHQCPLLPYDGIGEKHYLYDLVYNPAKSMFLQKGEDRAASIENGHDMLIIQADESRKIWNV